MTLVTGVVAVGVAVPSGAAGTFTAGYTRVQEWPGSYFQGQYTLTNGTASAITSWKLTFTLPAGDTLANWWGATLTQSGTAFTATGSSIAAGTTATFGFLATEGGGLADPANCLLNGGPCTGAAASPTPDPSPSRTSSPSPSPTASPTPSASPTPTGPPAAWHPSYLALGTVYTPYSTVDSYLAGARQHGQLPSYGYRYLVGNDLANWPTTVTTLVGHAHQLGMTPVLVEYGMNGNVDGTSVDFTNMQSASWLTSYFTALRAAAQAAATASGGAPVGWVIEPDMLGYLQQNYASTYGSASAMPAATNAAYASGVLSSGGDPAFGNNLRGLVEAINYVIKKYDPAAFIGWQVNDWAVRDPLKDTDTMGVTAGRQSIVNVASQVGTFVGGADIGYRADFVAFDQWGQDFGILRDPDPAGDIRYLNATHWNNYLLYVKTVRQAVNLPGVLWQIPVGHLNSTRTASPAWLNASGTFPDLDDVTSGRYEDSASTFFFGDSFTSSGNNLAFYGSNDGADPLVSVSGSTITWGSHMAAAASAGIVAILFGAGTGTGTEGVPEVPGINASGPTDSGYWIARAQQYLASPVPLP